jgi:hypothetical protein
MPSSPPDCRPRLRPDRARHPQRSATALVTLGRASPTAVPRTGRPMTRRRRPLSASIASPLRDPRRGTDGRRPAQRLRGSRWARPPRPLPVDFVELHTPGAMSRASGLTVDWSPGWSRPLKRSRRVPLRRHAGRNACWSTCPRFIPRDGSARGVAHDLRYTTSCTPTSSWSGPGSGARASRAGPRRVGAGPVRRPRSNALGKVRRLHQGAADTFPPLRARSTSKRPGFYK